MNRVGGGSIGSPPLLPPELPWYCRQTPGRGCELGHHKAYKNFEIDKNRSYPPCTCSILNMAVNGEQQIHGAGKNEEVVASVLHGVKDLKIVS